MAYSHFKTALECCLFFGVSLNGCCQESQFTPLSSHEGEIKSVLITVPIAYSAGVRNYDALKEADSILCGIPSSEWCIATNTQVSLCRPISHQLNLIQDLESSDSSLINMFSKLLNLSPKQPENASFIGDLDSVFLDYITDNAGDKENLLDNSLNNYFDSIIWWYGELESLLNSEKFLSDNTLSDSLVFRPSCLNGNGNKVKNSVRLLFGCNDLSVLIQNIPDWVQDEYIPQANGYEFKLSSRYVPSERLYRNLNQELSVCDLNVDDSFKLDLDGGNYVVSGKYIFIGADVLKKRYQLSDSIRDDEKRQVTKRLDKIDLTDSATENQVTDKLTSILGKKVIWVGGDALFDYLSQEHCSNDGQNEQCSYQPLVHIDMFMHPVSFENDTLRMMIALPHVKYNMFMDTLTNDTGQAAQLAQCLRQRIIDVSNSIGKQLKEDHVFLDTVVVPLPLLFPQAGKQIEAYYSFSNGLLSTGNKTEYFMPGYIVKPKQVHNKKALQGYTGVAKRSMGRYAEVKLIESRFTESSAVRCRTLVTSRN